MSLPDLALTFRAAGIDVREIPAWRARVRPGVFAPVGVIVHHTADKGRGDTGLSVLIDGRPDLVGPLCNASPREDGRLALIGAGRANHAGMGSGAVLGRVRRDLAPQGRAADLGLADTTVGNGYFYGLEVDNDGLGQRYSPAQITCTVRAAAALCKAHGWSANRVILHSEWSRRKVDWSAMSGAALRELVAKDLAVPADLLRPPVTPPPIITEHPATVREGDRGGVVRLLQQRLQAHGHRITADGVFGPATRRAVVRHQTAWKLDVDGIVGPRTWATLGR